jgi:hypothetical protein
MIRRMDEPGCWPISRLSWFVNVRIMYLYRWHPLCGSVVRSNTLPCIYRTILLVLVQICYCNVAAVPTQPNIFVYSTSAAHRPKMPATAGPTILTVLRAFHCLSIFCTFALSYSSALKGESSKGSNSSAGVMAGLCSAL